MKYSVVVVLCALALLASAQFPGHFHGGYVTVNEKTDANIFYYFVPSQGTPRKDPFIVWLQGGPGCSSLYGAFVENGPFIMQPDGTFAANPYSWTKNANVLWIDSPVNTGFSYINSDDYNWNQKQIAADLYKTIVTFMFKLHPHFTTNEFYIFGESYGGKYVPWLASTILANNANPSYEHKINIRGIGIGNGWFHPYYQAGSYGPFLKRNNMVNQSQVDAAEILYAQYRRAIEAEEYTRAGNIRSRLFGDLMRAAGVKNVYDYRTKSDPTAPLVSKLTVFLNSPETKAKLDANPHVSFEFCDSETYYNMEHDIDQSSAFLIPGILNKIPVLLYNGIYDVICNMDGTTTWSDNLQWPHQKDFVKAPSTAWIARDGKQAGWYKTAHNFTNLMVDNAGHMVPYDQPAYSLELLNKFINGDFK